MTFKYLGGLTSQLNRNLKEEMQAQTTKVASDIIWRNKYTSLRSKIRIKLA